MLRAPRLAGAAVGSAPVDSTTPPTKTCPGFVQGLVFVRSAGPTCGAGCRARAHTRRPLRGSVDALTAFQTVGNRIEIGGRPVVGNRSPGARCTSRYCCSRSGLQRFRSTETKSNVK